jgi:hypothetical protein
MKKGWRQHARATLLSWRERAPKPDLSLRSALPMTYHKDMARGWESKSVEEQQSSAGLSASGAVLDANKRDGLERAKRERQKQELVLQRERVLSERTSSPVRRAALEAALADIESRLALLS